MIKYLFLLLMSVITEFSLLSAVEVPRLPQVTVQQMKKGEIFDTLTFPARLVPGRVVPVHAEGEGVITSKLVYLGQQVTKGTPLFVLENGNRDYNSAPQKVIALSAGIVGNIEVSEGSRVQKGTQLALISSIDHVKIVIEIPVSDLAVFHMNMAGELTFRQGNDIIPVKISGLTPIVDSGTGTTSCELTPVSKTDGVLIPGMVGRVSFRVRQHKGFELSQQAVVYRGSQPFVRIVEAGKVKYLPIVIGAKRNAAVEVLEGVADGMQVVLSSSAYIGEGESVAVQN